MNKNRVNYVREIIMHVTENNPIKCEKRLKLIDVRNILYKTLMNIGFYIGFHPNQQLNKKAKTTNNGSLLKLFKTLTARVLSSLKILGLRLIKHCCSCFKHYIIRCKEVTNLFLFLSDEGPKRQTILSVLAVHQPFYISIRISAYAAQQPQIHSFEFYS